MRAELEEEEEEEEEEDLRWRKRDSAHEEEEESNFVLPYTRVIPHTTILWYSVRKGNEDRFK